MRSDSAPVYTQIYEKALKINILFVQFITQVREINKMLSLET
jgi:hypothetical protein